MKSLPYRISVYWHIAASASQAVSVMRAERGARCAVHTPLQELMLTSLTMSMEVLYTDFHSMRHGKPKGVIIRGHSPGGQGREPGDMHAHGDKVLSLRLD